MKGLASNNEKTRQCFDISKSWRDAIKAYQAKNRSTLNAYYLKAIKVQMIKDGIFVEDGEND